MDFIKAAELFDFYIDWDRRLTREMPLIRECLAQAGAHTVADVACGTGHHAVALAEAGYEVTAMDPDATLLERTRVLAQNRNARMDLVQAPFEALPGMRAEAFDGVICMGNSIALVPPGRAFQEALDGLAALLRPGGTMLLHTLNFPMLARREDEPWGPVRTKGMGFLVLKGIIPRESGPWDVVLVTLEQDDRFRWHREVARFEVHPHSEVDIRKGARKAGLTVTEVQGGFAGESPREPRSGDLVYRLVKDGGTA